MGTHHLGHIVLARFDKQVGKGVLGRVLLRIPMHRFPVFQWGEWLGGGTHSRNQGPWKGEMVIMVWDTAAARTAAPLGQKELGLLGSVCRGELEGGVSWLRTKIGGAWVPLSRLVRAPPIHDLSWLRNPPQHVG